MKTSSLLFTLFLLIIISCKPKQQESADIEKGINILEKVDASTYQKIHREIGKDNDYQSIQKIIHNFEKFNYSSEDLDGFMDDLRALFLADGSFDTLEKNLLMGLKKILR